MNSQGQRWGVDDLANYTVHVEEALSTTFRNTTVYTTDAPTSGPQLISMLNILEGFEVSSKKKKTASTNAATPYLGVGSLFFVVPDGRRRPPERRLPAGADGSHPVDPDPGGPIG